jgi:hypothetical protein
MLRQGSGQRLEPGPKVVAYSTDPDRSSSPIHKKNGRIGKVPPCTLGGGRAASSMAYQRGKGWNDISRVLARRRNGVASGDVLNLLLNSPSKSNEH